MATNNTNAIEKTTPDTPERAEQSGQVTYYTPLCDIAETRDAFLFQADLPGAKADEVDISYDSGTLIIQSKVQPRQPTDVRYMLQEYGVGYFYRSFNIATPVNAEAIKAELKNGVLSLYVPKAESAKVRRIQVQTS